MELCGFFFVNHLQLTDDLLSPAQMSKDKVALILQAIIWSLDAQENWKREGIEKAAHEVADTFGVHMKKVIIPILYGSIMGKRNGPPLFDSLKY